MKNVDLLRNVYGIIVIVGIKNSVKILKILSKEISPTYPRISWYLL